MTNYHKLICFYVNIISVFFLFPSHAQKTSTKTDLEKQEIVQINLDKGTIPKSLPFDTKFKLEITSEKYQLGRQVHLVKVAYNKGRRIPKSELTYKLEYLSANLEKDAIEEYQRKVKEKYDRLSLKRSVELKEVRNIIITSKKRLSDNYLNLNYRQIPDRIVLDDIIDKFGLNIDLNKTFGNPDYSNCKELNAKYNELDSIKENILKGKESVELKKELEKVRKQYFQCRDEVRHSLIQKKISELSNSNKINEKNLSLLLTRKYDSMKLENGSAKFDYSDYELTYPIDNGKIKPIVGAVTKSTNKKNVYEVKIEELLPNTEYDLIIFVKPSKKEIESFYKVIYQICKADPKAPLTYRKEIVSLEDQNRQTNFRRISTDFNRFASEKYPLFQENILILNHRLSFLQDSIEAQDPSFFKPWNVSLISQVGRTLIDKKFDISILSRVSNAFSQNKKTQLKYYGGMRKIGNDKAFPSHQYAIRKNNIDSNLKLLDSVLIELKKLKFSYSSESSMELLKRVNSTKQFLIKIQREFKKFEDFIKTRVDNLITFALPAASSTSSPNIKTQNSKVLIKDFGFMVAGAYNSQGEVVIIPRPTLGVNIHFGGINKEQKVKSITKDKRRFWHTSSLALGVTLGRIDENGYSDLFNNISPYLGMNFKLNRQIRLGAGVLFVNDSDPNPIVESNIFDPSFYTIITLDYAELFGDLKDLLKF